MKNKELRNRPIGTKVSETEYELLKQVAYDDCRSISSFIKKIVLEAIDKEGEK